MVLKDPYWLSWRANSAEEQHWKTCSSVTCMTIGQSSQSQKTDPGSNDKRSEEMCFHSGHSLRNDHQRQGSAPGCEHPVTNLEFSVSEDKSNQRDCVDLIQDVPNVDSNLFVFT